MYAILKHVPHINVVKNESVVRSVTENINTETENNTHGVFASTCSVLKNSA